MEKQWYLSKAKWGALLVGLAGISTAIAGGLKGSLDWGTVINTVITIGTGLGIWGIRDAMPSQAPAVITPPTQP